MKNEETTETRAQRLSSHPWSNESHLQQRPEWIWSKERRQETDPKEEGTETIKMVDMNDRTVLKDKKKEMQIRRAILRFEKPLDKWPPEKTTTEGRLFIITFEWFLSSYSTSHIAMYSVKDKKTEETYKAKHYLGNQYFDRSTGWLIERMIEHEW